MKYYHYYIIFQNLKIEADLFSDITLTDLWGNNWLVYFPHLKKNKVNIISSSAFRYQVIFGHDEQLQSIGLWTGLQVHLRPQLKLMYSNPLLKKKGTWSSYMEDMFHYTISFLNRQRYTPVDIQSLSPWQMFRLAPFFNVTISCLY